MNTVRTSDTRNFHSVSKGRNSRDRMQKARRESAWRIAAGLQAVDGLEPSETFWQLAQKNIDGRITFSQAEDCLKEKYRKERPGPENRTWEADRAACRMASLLMDDSFQLSAAHFLGLH